MVPALWPNDLRREPKFFGDSAFHTRVRGVLHQLHRVLSDIEFVAQLSQAATLTAELVLQPLPTLGRIDRNFVVHGVTSVAFFGVSNLWFPINIARIKVYIKRINEHPILFIAPFALFFVQEVVKQWVTKKGMVVS